MPLDSPWILCSTCVTTWGWMCESSSTNAGSLKEPRHFAVGPGCCLSAPRLRARVSCGFHLPAFAPNAHARYAPWAITRVTE